MINTTQLRAQFAARLSALYGSEVPAYRALVEVSEQVNHDVMRRDGSEAEQFGDLSRVTAERHGAIRVGSPQELAALARIFRAFGMHPVGFYDLRDARPRPVPVVSTAFRPIDRAELAANPFRMFTSMLVPEDRRFFDADLESRLKNALRARRLFPETLLELADSAAAHGELDAPTAERFLDMAVAAFALSSEPVDQAWYAELEAVSSVAADIGGVSTTHINHLTPRVLDIDELYKRMSARGIEMIDTIQGPPRWRGPDVLLRQTSFKALSEPRSFRDKDGRIFDSSLRVRFGEVESRGSALTISGRDLYDELVRSVDQQVAGDPDADRPELLQRAWEDGFPDSELQLWRDDLAHFTYSHGGSSRRIAPGSTLAQLVETGSIEIRPIVYEDFLPRSAAGIFSSNLTGTGSTSTDEIGVQRNLDWMSDVVSADIFVSEELYRAESAASLASVRELLLEASLTPS